MPTFPLGRTGLALAALALAAPAPAAAQHEVSAGLAISMPQGELDDNTDTGYGFAGSYVYGLGSTRTVGIGVGGSFLNYGRAERRVALSPTIPDIDVDIETANNMGFITGLLQLKAPTRSVQPYVVGVGGVGLFATTTTLTEIGSERDILSDTNQSDWTWAWGGGGGIQALVYGSRSAVDGREPTRVYVDVGARWLRGGDVEYLREGSLVTDEGEFDIDQRLVRSEIELVQLQLGVAVEF